MICPKCKALIEEDKLYCDHCGYEVNIVPVFEPEVYENVQKTLQDIGEDIEETPELPPNFRMDDVEIEDDDRGDRPSLLDLFFRKGRSRNGTFVRKLIAVLIFLLMIGGVAFLVRYLFKPEKKQSFDSHYQMAMSYAEQGRYEQAIVELEQAIAADSSRTDARIKCADYYMMLGKEDSAVNLYLELVDDPEKGEAISLRIAEYYLKQKDYAKLNRFLLGSQYEGLRMDYNEYIALAPQFNLPEGTYEKYLEISLTANSNGRIFYTLDGSVPSYDSYEYTDAEKIQLRIGIHTVTAIFVNEYGQVSEPAVARYVVDARNMDAPGVNVTGGDYSSPEYLFVTHQAGSTVYYTTDGTDPSLENGEQYTGVIPMRLGKTTYKFIAYNTQGDPSMIVEIETNLNIHYVVSVEDSVNSLIRNLVALGVILDTDGHAEGKRGRYTYACDKAFCNQNMILYLVEECYLDTDGTEIPTGKKYAIDSGSGYLYSVSTDSYGYLIVSPLR